MKDLFFPLCFAVMTVQTVCTKKNLKEKGLDKQDHHNYALHTNTHTSIAGTLDKSC